jgi:hypothetical protein
MPLKRYHTELTMAKYPGLEKDRMLLKEILSSGEKFLVVSRSEGLGDVLFAVAHAWYYCQKTGRTLIVDLAESRYLNDLELNAAFHLLTFPETYKSVKIITPPIISFSFRQLLHEGPLLRALILFSPTIYIRVKMLLKRLLGWDTRPKELSLMQEKELISTGRQVNQKFLFFKGCHCEFKKEVSGFLHAILPAPGLRIELAAFLSTVHRPFIGLHVRYFDPNYFCDFRHREYWVDFEQAINEIVDRIKVASMRVSGAEEDQQTNLIPTVFIATDSEKVQAALLERIEKTAIYPKNFHILDHDSDPMKRELHDYKVVRLGEDAVIEMFALANADILVRYPPSDSWFSELASIKCAQVIAD